MIKAIIVQAGQSLWDISLQELGSYEGVFYIADANKISDITGNLGPGTLLNIDDSKIINQEIVDYYKYKGIRPATSKYVEIINIIPFTIITFGGVIPVYAGEVVLTFNNN